MKKLLLPPLLLPLLGLVGFTLAGEEPAWPEFHGPARDNMCPETGLLKQWPAQGPKLLWKYSGLGKGYSSVSIARGLIFTSGDFGSEEAVTALDLRGNLKWKTVNGLAWKGPQAGSRTTPTYNDGLVYQLNAHGLLAAMDAMTGKILWSINIASQFESQVRPWGYAENVIIDGDLLLCTPGGAKGRVVALNKKTGQTVWANVEITDKAAYGSPIIARHKGTRVFINFMRETVVGVEVKTGKLLFSWPHRSTCDQNVTSPIFHQGKVFVTSGHRGGGRMFALDDAMKNPTEAWFDKNFDNCHGGVILAADHLYFAGCRLYNKGLICVNLETGKKQYRAEDVGKVSITWADGLLYCMGNDGEVLLVKATPDKADIISRFAIPREDEDHTLTHPVILDKKLYVRHLNDLLVYDVAETR